MAGFASWGWVGFTTLNGQHAEGGWYLAKYLNAMREAEEEYGKRLIDYVDLHWYPEARGTDRVVFGGQRETNAANVAARLQAPMSLWHPE